MKKLLRKSFVAILVILSGCSGTDDVEDGIKDVTDGLIVEYKFDGNTLDSSENKLNAEPFGGEFVKDRFAKDKSAFYFDGVNDYLKLPNSALLKSDLPLSISFWINYSSEDFKDRDLFNTSFEENKSSGIWFNTQSTTGKYSVSFGNNTNNYTSSNRRTYITNKVIEINSWHHVMIVLKSADDMKIFIDNVEYGGEYSGEAKILKYSINPGNIGRHDRNTSLPANYFKGYLDDFRIWNRALTLEEINRVYEIQKTN